MDLLMYSFIPTDMPVRNTMFTQCIAGALYLVEKINNPTVAQQIADVMAYNRDAALPPYTLPPPYATV
jgi:hypothetical protein